MNSNTAPLNQTSTNGDRPGSSNTAILCAALASAITLLAVGFALYGVVFKSLFQQGALTLPGVMRSEPLIGWILLAHLAFGWLVALMVAWRGKLGIVQGAFTGAVFGLLMSMGFDFSQFGTSYLWTRTATLIDPFITAALIASAGATAGFVLRRFQPNRRS